MKIWLNANLSPVLAAWISKNFDVACYALVNLKLRDEDDETVFKKARDAKAILITRDFDFVDLVLKRGAPPKVLLISVGNCSNAHLKKLFKNKLQEALSAFAGGEDIVELTDEEKNYRRT